MPPEDTADNTERAEASAVGEAGAAENTAQAADEVAQLRTEVERLQRELDEARERADRYHSNWQRSAADFQNWKRRTDQEKTELTRYAEGALTVELLRVLDDFERAFGSLPPELRMLTWIEGVYMIGQKLYAVLQGRGLSPIEADGQEFDPILHEAVLREDDAEGADRLVVVQDLQRGYRFHERVLRPSMVKVGRPKGEPAEGSTAEATAPPSEGVADSPTEDS